MSELTIDFTSSFVTWKLHDAADFGRFSIDAACILNSGSSTETFFLAAGVMAGNVYGDGYLLRQPPYRYQAVFSESHYRIFRVYASQHQDQDTIGKIGERFERLELSINRSDYRKLENFDAIIGATFGMLPINAHVELELGYSTTAELIFPVRHINIESDRQRFQAETGPVLAPLEDHSGTAIDRLMPAFIAFNQLDDLSLAFLAETGSISGDTGYGRFYCGIRKTAARICLVVPENQRKET